MDGAYKLVGAVVFLGKRLERCETSGVDNKMTYTLYPNLVDLDTIVEINALVDGIDLLRTDQRGPSYQSVQIAHGDRNCAKTIYDYGFETHKSLFELCISHIPGELVNWTAYIIRCRPNGFIPAHNDSPVPRHEWWRFNIRLTPAETGGKFVLGEPIDVEQGDGLMFRADTQLHEVSRCTQERRMLSIGAVVDND